jgi:ATP-binding cassette subfamily B protein
MQQMRKAWQDICEVQKILMVRPEITDTVDALPLRASHADIVFENVSFGYNEKRTILNAISFSMPAGKTVAIVGSTGSGKSTIVRLLFRFFDVTNGAITINGHDIRLLTQESLHKAIGIVPQDTVLFNNTIYFNIASGNPQASRQEVEQAAKDAQLEEFIKQLPDGYQTEVGERGLKLSGGEKQRIAIARVLLKKPLIYIFDEATSALDSSTEREIQKNIRTVSFGNTTLIIAHRLSTIIHADTILVLENGNIVEQGNHHALLNQQSAYANLWYKQTKNINPLPERVSIL